MPSPFNPQTLSAAISQFVFERTEAMIVRFFPDFNVPNFFGGYHIFANERANLAYILAHLVELGVDEIAHTPMPEAIARTIKGVDGPRTETFYSYRISEALLPFGSFENNPILSDFSAVERENIAQACDSSHIYLQHGKPLGGRSNNYWGVLARCEFDRQRLGILVDETILNAALEKINAVMFNNPLGFFDDGADLSGRYDIYSPDTYLFLEPLWHLLDQPKLQHSLSQHVRLLEDIALENGASVFWGRSVGALSLCLTMELASLALREGLSQNASRMLGILQNAFEHYKTWFSDDLINAHRHKMTYDYRGPHRLLEMSTDNLAKLAYAALQLQKISPPENPGSAGILPAYAGHKYPSGQDVRAPSLFPQIDKLIPFHENGAGVWMYRNEHLAFQFPLVKHTGADYAPWFHSPGLLEVPVDTDLYCGLPRIIQDGMEYTCHGLPHNVEKTAHGLRLSYQNFSPINASAATPLPGKRDVVYQIEQDCIEVSETWHFENTPSALALHIPERDRPLKLSLDCPTPHHQHKIAVKGMPNWRNFWGEFSSLHEVNFAPQQAISFSYILSPVLKVTELPGDHNYLRSLYDAMPKGNIAEYPLHQGRHPDEMSLALLNEPDILHIGWPEHFFRAPMVWILLSLRQNFWPLLRP